MANPTTSIHHAAFRSLRFAACLLLVLCLVPAAVHAQDDLYSTDFEIPEVEESPYEFWGQAELRYNLRELDKSSSTYKIKFYDKSVERYQNDALLQVKPEFKADNGTASLYLRPRMDVAWSQMDVGTVTYDEPSESYFKQDPHLSGDIMLEEGVVSWRPSTALSAEAGKKVLKWGKGYAWNPVGFASRPKNVDDPDQSREGYVMAFGDYIRSLDGDLQTLSVTPVIMPVGENVNTPLADADTLLFGGKLYLLYRDIDIDLQMMTGDGYDSRFGADFALNLSDNFAIHGEVALRRGYDKKLITSKGVTSSESYDAWSFLAGLRYLTETDITYIVEYYHNGEGYSHDELKDFHQYVDRAYATYQSTGNANGLKKASKLSNRFSKNSAGQDYLYFRVSQKEPWDILYLTPILTIITNLNDRSASINPELTYMLSESLELRPRAIIPVGNGDTEFGEKMNAWRGELRLTYFF